MKCTVLHILIPLLLLMPAVCHGSTGVRSYPELPELEKTPWEAYHLVLNRKWCVDMIKYGDFDPGMDSHDGGMTGGRLDDVHGDLSLDETDTPVDMVSMVSYLWAQMFGGVDVVAEAKKFARQVRHKSRFRGHRPDREKSSRNHWRFVVSCRVDDRTEIAASLRNSGRFFSDSNLVLEVNALDPRSEEIGLSMAYSNGELDIRADRMTLTDAAEAKLVVKF